MTSQNHPKEDKKSKRTKINIGLPAMVLEKSIGGEDEITLSMFYKQCSVWETGWQIWKFQGCCLNALLKFWKIMDPS